MSFTTDHEEMLLCCTCQKVVQHPKQLHCLHNCCSACLDNLVVANGNKPVICPLCKDVTDVLPKDDNMFIAFLAKTSVTSGDMSYCSICAKEGHPNESAEVWCGQCQRSLCGDCLRQHARLVPEHVAVPLEEAQDRSSLPQVSAQQCQQHGKVFDLVCLTCAAPQCIDCGLVCARTKHHVHLLGSPEGDALVVKIKNDIRDLQETLESKSHILRKHKNLVGDLKTARMIHIDELEKKKRALLDAIDKAFLGAKATVHDSYDILDEKASQLSCLAEQMEDDVGLALKYSYMLVDAGGVINLLKQQQVLLSRLRSLAKELDQAEAPLDASEYVIMKSTEHEGCDYLIKEWIGTAVLVTDNLFGSTDQAQMCSARLKSRAGDNSQLQHSENQSDETHVPPEVLDFGPICSTFQSPVRCRDVAVSSDGCRLLLAALEHGLLECDMTGAQLSHWRPAEKTAKGGDEEVTAVEVLHDGTVAVGLRYSECVVLLRRVPAASSTWLKYKHITALGIAPWRLSIYADLVAVTDDLSLLLLSLSSGSVLSRQQREYGIRGVVVMSEAVVTASSSVVDPSNGRAVTLTDACSHDGQLLWRQELGDRVWDICAALSGGVLYMALLDSDRVTALRAEDGTVIKDVLRSSSHDLKSPARLSIGGRGQQTVAAVLSSCWRRVTVCKAKLGQ